MIAEVMDKQMVEKQNDTTVINKNVIDISNDSLIYDKHYDNPISFAKKVIARTSSPSAFKGKQLYYGQFITQLYNDGNIDGKSNMWDLGLAARSRVGGESLGKIKMFVCVVFIPELQFSPFPLKDDWEAIEQIALNGGIFKCEKYLLSGGAIPQYNDIVLVSFGDPNNRTEGRFEYPEVEGASAGAAGAAGGGGPGAPGYRGGGPAHMCKKGRKPKTPKPKQSKNTKTTAAGDTKKEKKAVTKKPKKPNKEETNKQAPAKKTIVQPACPAPLKPQPSYPIGKGTGPGVIVPCFQGNCKEYRERAGKGHHASGEPIMYRYGRRSGKPRFIVLHTGASSVGGTIRALAAKGLATHYEIAVDGTTYEYFPPMYYCAHAGKYNGRGIGIDFTGPARFQTAAQYLAAKKLIHKLCNDYGIPKLAATTVSTRYAGKRHAYFSDPGELMKAGVGVVAHSSISKNRSDPGIVYQNGPAGGWHMEKLGLRIYHGTDTTGAARGNKKTAEKAASGIGKAASGAGKWLAGVLGGKKDKKGKT